MSASLNRKASEGLKEQTFANRFWTRISVYLLRSIGRLFRIILLVYLKTLKLLLYSEQDKLVFMVRSIFLTALYLVNDLVQFAFVFVFIWYVYRCLSDSFVIWSAKNAELVVDFTSDPAY